MAKALIPSVYDITNLVRYVPRRAVLQWLKRHGKPFSTGANDKFYSTLQKWITKGKIGRDDIDSAVFDIEENGGKHIFLRTMDGEFPTTRKEFESFLDKSGIVSIQRARRSYRASERPILNHIVWETVNGSEYIVIKFSELQEEVEYDFMALRMKAIPKPVFIVFRIDAKTGFTEVRFDPPLQRHTHVDGEGRLSTRVYYNSYFDKLQNFFPKAKIEQYGLNDVCTFILGDRTLYRISREGQGVTGNGKQIYSLARGDVRDLPARIGAEAKDGKNWIVDDLVGYWKADASTGILFTDLFMRVSKNESLIIFQKECLGVELDYAIQKIREIKAKV